MLKISYYNSFWKRNTQINEPVAVAIDKTSYYPFSYNNSAQIIIRSPEELLKLIQDCTQMLLEVEHFKRESYCYDVNKEECSELCPYKNV